VNLNKLFFLLSHTSPLKILPKTFWDIFIYKQR